MDWLAEMQELERGAVIFLAGVNDEERETAFTLAVVAYAGLYRKRWPGAPNDVLKQRTEVFGRTLIRRIEEIELAGDAQAGRA